MNSNALQLNATFVDAGSHRNSCGRLFFLGERPHSSGPNQVLSGGEQFFANQESIEEKGQPYYTLRFFVSGSGSVVLDGRKHETFPGTVLLQRPGIPITIFSQGGSRLTQYFISFVMNDLSMSCWNRLVQSDPSFLRVEVTENRSLFESIIICGSSGVVSAQKLCVELLTFFVGRIENEEGNGIQRVDLARDSFERAKSYIDSHFSSIRNMEEVSQACNLSTPHLSRIFKRFQKQPPTEYLISLRMEKAADLLKKGNLLVKEIASEVGFKDPYYFSTCFRRYFGKSPRFFQN